MLIDLKLLGLVREFKFKQEAECFALTQREKKKCSLARLIILKLVK